MYRAKALVQMTSHRLLKQMLLTFTDSRLSNGGAEKTQKSSASRTRDFNNLESINSAAKSDEPEREKGHIIR
jgi:hypothetical protein